MVPQPTAPVKQSHEQTPVLNHFAIQADQVLLSTAVIYILDRDGLPFPCRALLDSGSHANFISERLSKMLRLESRLTNQPIKGIGGVSMSVSHSAQTVIRSKFSDFSAHLKFFVLPKISERIPIAPINKSPFQITKSIFLADHEFNVPSRVDALLGASIFWEILGEKRILLHNNVHLIETKLGWILGGKLNPNPDAMSIVPTPTCHLATTDMQLNDTLKQFWHIEEVSGTLSYTGEDAECEEHIQLNTTRVADGKYVVALPFKSDRAIIGDTEKMALRRHKYLENRLKNDHNLKTEYTKFMKEYIELNHMVEVTAKELAYTKHNFFLPHHPVIKPSSSTTKVRVVFDASAKSAAGISLNDTCMTGPVVQSDLFSILLRFRTHRYVFSTDIEKIYRQIWIKPEHAMLQLIFWKETDSSPLKIYKLLTVTYGTKPAAYLATRTLLQLSRDEKDFPRASEILARDFYVDDGMTGSETLEDAKAIRDELRQLLHKGGFHLRKWSSNHPRLLEDLPREDIAQEHLCMGKDSKIRTLGIVWDPNEDTFHYSINLKPLTPHNISKRAILGIIAQIFDPLGLIGPVIVTAKLIMQQLWQDGIDWDDAVPHNIAQSWTRFHRVLDSLNNFRVPRYIFSVSSTIVRREIHGFCDASERAYGACAYLRSVYSDNSIHVSLICAKSRVAPIKTASLPRLELCGALLLVQLLDKIKLSIHFSLDQFYYYTDSTIVLAWLSAPSTHWTTFVANRVAKIQDASHVKDWRHVKGSDNPADVISRGAYPDDLLNLHEWWNGPEWLRSDSSHPVALASDLNHADETPEAKQSLLTFVATNISAFDLSRFSSYNKLLATVAYCKRFIKIIKCSIQHDPNVPKGPLSVSELNDSLQTLLVIAQQQSFQRERELLGQGKDLQKDSKLINLHPFLDPVGLIRVGGRLTNSNLNSSSKHPIILCSKHKFTLLLITNEHTRLLHADQQSLLASIRHRYWPLNARNLIKKIIHNCIRCYRTNPGNMTQLMGDLPRSRLQETRPFYRTGVDYLGPVFVKPPYRKGNTQIKTNVALFICLSTKAVHLEIAEDLSANAFIDVLRRRGKPIEVLSDNATNFTRANKDLEELRILFERCHLDILNELSYQGIQFRFNPPRAPHFGGLWESNVKIVKNHIKRVMGNNILTLMEFNSLLCQIEACINSRPLHPLSQDPSDFSILTPSHFLIGDVLTAIPEPDLDKLKLSRLDHWQRIQKLQQQFWKAWSRDYLQELQTRYKWKHRQNNIKIGTLVLVKEDNLPPLSWKLARVEQLHPGRDGHVRVATLRTPQGLLKRPIVRLCPLPMDQEDDDPPITSVAEASK